MKRLCFGTLFKVLCQCKKDGVHNKDVIGKFTCCVDPECGYINSSDYVISKILKCESNVSDGRKGRYGEPNKIGEIKKISLHADKNDVAVEIKKIINETICPEKWELCIAMLFDIISEDKHISGNNKAFKLVVGEYSEDLIRASKINLPNLLAGLLLYTINEVNSLDDNCKKTSLLIKDDYINHLKDKVEKLKGRVEDACDVNDSELSRTAISAYEGINRILLAFQVENHKKRKKFDFPLFEGPFKIEDKINGQGSLLETDVKSDVVNYYNFIQDLIAQFDREEDAYSHETWSRINKLYKKTNNEHKTKEEIYYEILKLMDASIPDDDAIKKEIMYMSYLRIVASFYVQSCAIFKKEKNGDSYDASE